MSAVERPLKFQFPDGRQETITVQIDETVESVCRRLKVSEKL
jgi:hypothetical protein